MALRKLCRCGKIIDQGQDYCNECDKKHIKEKKDNNRNYDTNYRKNKEVYTDKQWRIITQLCKNKFNGLDIYAFFIYKKIVYGGLSHHIETIEDNPKRKYDLKNLIYLSDRSHREIHTAYNKSNKDKKDMQELLLSLIAKYEQGEGY